MSVEPTTRPDTDLSASLSTTASAAISDFHTQLSHAHGRGRQVRPRLFLEVYAALSHREKHPHLRVTERPEIQQVAHAIEHLHTSFLIHDDVIDHDTMRRGHTNINGHFELVALSSGASAADAHTLGNTAGILGGVLALTEALMQVAALDFPHRQRQRLLTAFQEAISLSALGELLDVHAATIPAPTPMTDTITIAELKTAEYSFVLPMRLAAIMADHDDASTDALAGVGRHLGVAYQLHDDLNGVFAPTSVTGKEVGADLRENKDTLLIAHARTTDAWPELERLLGPTITPLGVMRAQELLIEAGSARFVEQQIRDHLCIAMTTAHEHNLETSDIPILNELIEGLAS